MATFGSVAGKKGFVYVVLKEQSLLLVFVLWLC